MAMFDLPPDRLEEYLSPIPEPEGFDAFWQETLAEVRSHDLAATFELIDVGLRSQDVYDVTFAGFGGQPVKGWLMVPKRRSGPLPCVVEYIGYGGGRGLATSHTLFASAGFAHLVMDTRGQGSGGSKGATADAGANGEPQYPGFLTRGLSSPHEHYYRRVFSDAVRAVEAARSHPDIDGRIIATGGSQGGGIALAVAGLVDDLTGVWASQPFLCHYERAVAITDAAPYSELTAWLKQHQDMVDTAFTTLGFMDGVNFSKRANAPAQFSVGLMDTVCPPSTIYAAYNVYAAEKHMHIFPFNGHDGGGGFGQQARIDWLHEMLD